ncbi:1-deoxy-D-xylulose-5-phosphate reductoisomerase [Psychromonas antarctica]|jgi:1-deoxy-D-xylulose-5-phosphate reductoisomerase|uniref:1-deoxy-D-xylulose-5-phosphate reductoisomerase n=1 Tax=Psychromonas antarctica TaxID=67573 RepID=UPI001EE9861A|nr:1-deoxy-D-xylulose-5-phosphate reductoisomerase [Psychromonas antarctica]MCG6199673.1 1-deoxy-D-xylulose-5-phosphate reductoisomerase [Psychromonas antarctica]
MKKLAILGATGSIGASTLSVCRANPDLYQITLLAAASSVDKMFLLCQEFSPLYVSMSDKNSRVLLAERLKQAALPCQLLKDQTELLQLLGSNEVDSVMAAIVGGAGLTTTLAAVNAGKEIFLANKEALVMSGALFIDAVIKSGAKLWPVDSEHNAIYQALSPNLQNNIGACDLHGQGVAKILLTGSGGPFLEKKLSDFATITAAQAVKHPNWSMGQKISIDSATMMNKGLEYIEARWLFNASREQLQVVIHPQSVIHSMVQYKDGSVIAQMGNPDMRIPIAHVMGGGQRIDSGAATLDFFSGVNFNFSEPDFGRYPCLKLAIDACYQGQQATTSLNAANEVAVDAFLNQQIKFTQISQLVERVLTNTDTQPINSIEHLLEIDSESKALARQIIKRDLLC